MNRTKIEWVKNPDGTQGYTWNPITGCLNGCEYCYARRLANTRLKERYLANCWLSELYGNELVFDRVAKEAAYKEHSKDPFYPRFWPERMWLHPLVGSKRKPKGIFVCDMSDLFGIGIPEDWTRRVLDVIGKHPQHRFYLLTKQPQNLEKFSPFPENAWVGVTATDSYSFSYAMFYLSGIKARVKYLSIEPFLEQILPHHIGGIEGVDGVIIGSQTKPYKPPKIEWVEEIVKAADSAGIPVFLKDNLKPLILKEEKLPIWAMEKWKRSEFFNLRQEMPTIKVVE